MKKKAATTGKPKAYGSGSATKGTKTTKMASGSGCKVCSK